MRLFALLAPVMLQAGDSVTTRILVEDGWLATVANIGQTLVSLMVVVMLLLIVLILYALKKGIDELTKLVRTSYEPVRSVIQEAKDVTSEIRSIAKAVRAPAESIGETVEDANMRVRALMGRAEERLERIDHLVEVVQEEAQGAFVRSASVLKGVGVGGAALGAAIGMRRRNGKRRRLERRMEARAAEADALIDAASDADSAPRDDADEGPRIRPRPPRVP